MSVKKSNYWYVLVMTDAGPVFVTKVNYANKTAEWDREGKPLEMDKSRAQDLTLGLNLNMHMSVAVCQPFQLDSQPYNYKKWQIKWEEREKQAEE